MNRIRRGDYRIVAAGDPLLPRELEIIRNYFSALDKFQRVEYVFALWEWHSTGEMGLEERRNLPVPLG